MRTVVPRARARDADRSGDRTTERPDDVADRRTAEPSGTDADAATDPEPDPGTDGLLDIADVSMILREIRLRDSLRRPRRR